jgi:hypothetical protein
MKNIRKTSDLVKHILQTIPQTRNSKDYLVKCVYEHINKDSVNLPYWELMARRKELLLPPYGSITRAMRKLQKAYPELGPNDEVAGWRAVNEEIVKDYARSVNV